MTAQIGDTVIYQGKAWDLAELSGEGLFDPAAWGLPLVPMTSACWRGHVCRYEVKGGALYLAGLRVALGRAGTNLGTFEAAELTQAPLPFTGRLTLARQPVARLQGNMGFPPAWTYRRVRELRFQRGRLAGERDVSAGMAAVRKAKLDRPGKPVSPGQPRAYRALVKRCFGRRPTRLAVHRANVLGSWSGRSCQRRGVAGSAIAARC
ncbi:MAG TPA: hypothetical protein PKY77_22035 [Phycisphaerae bacterium]|nr:hypothetical protein [Phycisphaerae bacterium]